MPDASAVQDWLRTHRLLMQQEAAFSELAIRAAAGEVPLEELASQREQLLALRMLCMSVYNKAFPPANSP